MIKSTFILSSVLMTVGFSACAQTDETQDARSGFGKVSEGWQMEAEPDTFWFQQGKNINLRFAQWNRTKTDQVVLLGDDEKLIHLDVTDQDGKPIAQTEHGKNLNNPLMRGSFYSTFFKQLKPGEKVEYTVSLNKLFDVSKPGVYYVTGYNYTGVISAEKPKSKVETKKAETKIVARTFQITVRAN